MLLLFFDEHQKTFVLTSKSTGTFNRDEKELTFGGSLFTSTFGLNEVKNGQNAQFTLNGLETERRENIFFS